VVVVSVVVVASVVVDEVVLEVSNLYVVVEVCRASCVVVVSCVVVGVRRSSEVVGSCGC